jgi:hypothetical protein
MAGVLEERGRGVRGGGIHIQPGQRLGIGWIEFNAMRVAVEIEARRIAVKIETRVAFWPMKIGLKVETRMTFMGLRIDFKTRMQFMFAGPFTSMKITTARRPRRRLARQRWLRALHA